MSQVGDQAETHSVGGALVVVVQSVGGGGFGDDATGPIPNRRMETSSG